MSHELLPLIEQISREKGVDKVVLKDALLAAILSAARKRFGLMENLHVRLDEETGEVTVYSLKTVTLDDDIIDDSLEINLEEAETLQPHVKLGDVIEVTHELGDLGRIAAQTAKQVIIQKVREAERDMIYREFKDRQGELVHGIVSRIEREGNLFVDLGKTEGLLPRREQSFREAFKRGDRIRAYITEVKKVSSGPQILLSRTHPGFLMRLFEMEVPEIYEGIVEIKGAVRDSSGRAKIAVMSRDKDVDPIGACVGMKGMRVQAVVQELRGEKIDIIQWTEDPTQFVQNALSPAKVMRIHMQEADKTMQVQVAEDQLSLAIGKRGQNVRLAAKLTHWKIDIKSEKEGGFDSARQEALRRAESAFHLPRRLTEESAEEVEAAADRQPSGACEETTTALDSAGAEDEKAVLSDPSAFVGQTMVDTTSYAKTVEEEDPENAC